MKIENSFLYIVGVGRSGTSLLQSILGSHSEIHALPETSFLRRYIFASTLDVSKVTNDDKLERIANLKVNIMKDSCSSRATLYELYRRLLRDADTTYVLDKDPRLIEYGNLISELDHDCKFLILNRDPRDVLASKLKAQWSRGRMLLSYLVASRVQLLDGERLLRNKKRATSLYYEDLIGDSERVVKRLCSLLGIEFEPDMMNFQRTARQLVDDSEFSWKKETLQPINSSNSGNWALALTSFQATVALRSVADIESMQRYKQQGDLAILTEFASFVFAVIVKLLSFIYRKRRDRSIQSVLSEMA